MKISKPFLIGIGLAFVAGTTSAQVATQKDSAASETAADLPLVQADDPVLAQWDSLLVSHYMTNYVFDKKTDVVLSNDSIIDFDASLLAHRLDSLDGLTPMNLDYNRTVGSFIKMYGNSKRELTQRVLGLQTLYFPMFEEKLNKYGIPLELKYLAIVESALNPTAKSRVGATGLWQFMYPTGKGYGLRVSSYVDDRMDPEKATEAACKYLKYLHGLYDDWNLALAAYNSGPGNVNKAIRRSGGKKDFWAIQRNLPRETRSYVPAFIAVNYIMEFAQEHGIEAIPISHTYWECDTVHVDNTLKFDQITAFTEVTTAELRFLNPAYQRNIIPNDGRGRYLRLPVDKMGLFVANEDSIYNFRKEEEQPVAGKIITEERVVYRVRSGDVLGKIAERHGVRLSQLKSWNNLRGNTIRPGQKLVMYKSITSTLAEKKAPNAKTKGETASSKTSAPAKRLSNNYKYHTVKRGDTLWDIANLYDGVTVNQIKNLNRGLNAKNLKLGQKIKIKPV